MAVPPGVGSRPVAMRGRSGYEYKAVVPYDDLTFTIEFMTRDRAMFEPDFLRATVRSFRVRTGDHVDWVEVVLALLTAVAVLGLVRVIRRWERRDRKERAARAPVRRPWE